MAGLVHKKKLGTFSSFKAAYITSFLVILYLTINEFVSWKWNCSWDIFIRVWIYQNTQVIHRFQWIEFLKQDKLFLLYNYNHYFEREINTWVLVHSSNFVRWKHIFEFTWNDATYFKKCFKPWNTDTYLLKFPLFEQNFMHSDYLKKIF